jgi:hypothetical protein
MHCHYAKGQLKKLAQREGIDPSSLGLESRVLAIRRTLHLKLVGRREIESGKVDVTHSFHKYYTRHG